MDYLEPRQGDTPNQALRGPSRVAHKAHESLPPELPEQQASLEVMAGPTRLELATSGVTGRRSNQLNYDPAS